MTCKSIRTHRKRLEALGPGGVALVRAAERPGVPLTRGQWEKGAKN